MIVAMLGLCATVQAAALDTGFEDGMAPFKRGWGKPSVDMSVAHSGKASLQITGGGQVKSAPIAVDAAAYRITGWMKTEGIVKGPKNYNKACAVIFYLGEDKKLRKHGRGTHTTFVYMAGTNDWTPFEYVLKINPKYGVKYFQVGLQNWNVKSGTTWFDDVKVEALDASEAKAAAKPTAKPTPKPKAAGPVKGAVEDPTAVTTSFEDGMGLWKREWGKSVKIDKAMGHTGGASLRLDGSGAAKSPLIPVKGRVLTFSLWMKTDGIEKGPKNYNKACANVRYYDENGKPATVARKKGHTTFAYTAGTTDWTHQEFQIMIPPKYGVAYVELRLQNWNVKAGTTWFDDVKVEVASGGDVRKAMIMQRRVRLPDGSLAFAAEVGTLGGGAAVATKKDAYEKTVLLKQPGDAVSMDIDLKPGTYSVRVRSSCAKNDTFNEIVPSWNGEKMRAHPVTNEMFTWQRSPFRDGVGKGTLRIELAEGSDVSVDEIVVHPFAAGYEIKALREYAVDTPLVVDGKARCVIVTGDGGLFKEQAEALATALEKRSGVKPDVVGPESVMEKTFQDRHVVALGSKRNNVIVIDTMPSSWFRVPDPPESGPQVFIATEPYGTGHNLVTVGGETPEQVALSVDSLIERLQGDKTLTLPFCQVPPNGRAQASSREAYRESAIESGQWLRQGNIRHLYYKWKHAPHDIFRLLSYRVMEYRESPETIKRAAYDGAIDMEHYKVMCYFDRAEHYGVLSDLERLDIVNVLLAQAEYCESRFEVECGPSRTSHSDEVMEKHLAARRDDFRIAHNHQTFTNRTLLTAGNYFSRYYGLAEAKKWLDWADTFMMTGPLQTSKPQCDCFGYQSITMMHAARHASDTGRWDYFDGEPVNMFLRFLLMQFDNLGSAAGHGDVGGYQVPLGPDFRDQAIRNWTQQCAGRYDFPLARLDQILGLYIHPLEPLWYKFYAHDGDVPLANCFDKISFRNAVDPDEAYLILDGLSMGYHGHWDGNSILRFTDNNRMWLCEGSYIKTDPKEHNALTIMRDGVSARPGQFSALRHAFVSPRWGITVTRTPDYSDVDWDRVIVWHRKSGAVVVADAPTAKKDGTYDFTAYFRSLGDTALEGRTWRVEQKDGERFYMHFPGEGDLSTASAPDDAKTWQKYPYSSDPVPKIVRHRVLADLKKGEKATLFTAFYAAGKKADPRLTVRKLGPSAMALRGGPEGVFVLGDYKEYGFDARGAVAVLGAKELALVDGTRLMADGKGVEADKPVSICFDPTMAVAVVEAKKPTRVSFKGAGSITGVKTMEGEGKAKVRGSDSVVVPAGKFQIDLAAGSMPEAFAGAFAKAWAAAEAKKVTEAPTPRPTNGMRERFAVDLPSEILCLATGQVDGKGGADAAAGCVDGTVAVVDADGNELWRKQLPAKVNDIVVADLDGDGRAEVLCGVEDSHLYVFGPDGTERLKRFFEAYRSSGGIEGHVRCVMVDDMTGDGKPEIAVGCANTFYYVMNPKGEVLKTGGQSWRSGGSHKGLGIFAADMTGDGVKELLASQTYHNRWMVDFTNTSRARAQSINGTKAGCRAITAIDADGDGQLEAVFGDMDGQLSVAKRRTDHGRGPGIVAWQKMVGTDEISALRGGDFDGDGEDEILLASHSGFLALLSRAGDVEWTRYAANLVTDAEVATGAAMRFVRSSADGSVAIYDAKGDETARWLIGTPVQRIAVPEGGKAIRVYAAAGSKLLAGEAE